MARVTMKYYRVPDRGYKPPELDYIAAGGFGVVYPTVEKRGKFLFVAAPRYVDMSDDMLLPWFPDDFSEIPKKEYDRCVLGG